MNIYRLAARKKLPSFLVGRLKRFRHSDIEAFLEEHWRERDRIDGADWTPTSPR